MDKLAKPIIITMKNIAHSNSPVLAWWDVNEGLWQKDVCHLVSSVSVQVASLSFECHHMGYFSLFTEQDDNSLFYEKE